MFLELGLTLGMNKRNFIIIRRIIFSIVIIGVFILATTTFIIVYLNMWAPNPRLITAVNRVEIRDVENALHSGADPNFVDEITNTPLIIACFRNSNAIAKLLLKSGSNVNACSASGYTPLMYACQNRNESMVKMLLEHGAKTGMINKNGWTARDISIQRGQTKIAELLASHSETAPNN